MKITRYLNGSEITVNDLYSQNIVTDELVKAISEARRRAEEENRAYYEASAEKSINGKA